MVNSWTRRYWNKRWRADGRGPGRGSTPDRLIQKAQYLNMIIERYGVESVLDLGCGDARIYPLLNPVEYIGLDVSERALARAPEGATVGHLQVTDPPTADMAMSIDVLYHLVDDGDYLGHLHTLFTCAREVVVIYSTDKRRPRWPWARHVKHRRFTEDVAERFPEWRLVRGNAPSLFHLYERRDD